MQGNVFITGGAGYLGRGFIRAAHKSGLFSGITVYSRDEEKQASLKRRYPDVRMLLGDVRDIEHLKIAMAGHDIVIHAGAVKFVPEAEFNVHDTVDVNVFGSRNVAHAAAYAGVEKVIGISTDKAVLPVNTYGATKMLMERIFSEYSSNFDETIYTCVRYGNVIGSTGSIIPVFKDQLERTGRVTVTDPKMTRFWLTIDEAVGLILRAIDAPARGCTFVSKCPAMSLWDLANIITTEDRIDIVGKRPGEKMHEELVAYAESVRTKNLGDGFLILPPTTPEVDVNESWTYASHSPARWIIAEEMRAAIEDAETV